MKAAEEKGTIKSYVEALDIFEFTSPLHYEALQVYVIIEYN